MNAYTSPQLIALALTIALGIVVCLVMRRMTR